MNGFVAGQFRISKPETGFQQKAGSYRDYGDGSQFQKTTGLARKRTTGTAMPRENSIHKGLVVCTKEYGAFVQLGKGEKFKDGFLHIGCLPNPPGVERVEVVNSVVREGDTVWVKVRDVDEENGKYALDMRFVHQKDGQDLDPFNGRGRVPKDVGWVFPKQQLKHIHAANAVISSQREGFELKSEIEKRKEEEEQEALRRMQVESSDESDPEDKKQKKMKKKLEKQKQKLEKLKQMSEAKAKENDRQDRPKEKEKVKEKVSEKEEKRREKGKDKEKAKDKPKEEKERKEKKAKKRQRDSSS
ncbi:Polyribonucleotide nucleotidyltransferase (Polynucleotide phosphorylase) (PNPase) [Durusdinium trenchii]|uniref:Polyribonucleotide nucleotidyltransferase (Polynucleotide phosphorylase) (PNPase) n=1 Tax=Durusdinium trenchii TaxID=1381693 RepID=A0ABP0J545_9DINO